MCKFTSQKTEKSGFQDPSKYAPRAPQDRPRRHLDPQGPSRSSQGLSGTSLGPSQDAPERPGTLPGPPPNPQVSAQGPFRSSQGVSGTSLRGRLRTLLQGLPGLPRTPWNLSRTCPGPPKHSLRSSQNPAAPPRTCSRTAQDASMTPRPAPPEQRQNLFMIPQAPSLQPPSLQRPRRDSRSDNN